MDQDTDTRRQRRWLVIGGALGGIAGLVLGVWGLLDGEPATMLFAAPAFACFGAAVLPMLRHGSGPMLARELDGVPGPDKRRFFVRTFGTALALMAAGVGFFVLTGASEL